MLNQKSILICFIDNIVKIQTALLIQNKVYRYILCNIIKLFMLDHLSLPNLDHIFITDFNNLNLFFYIVFYKVKFYNINFEVLYFV